MSSPRGWRFSMVKYRPDLGDKFKNTKKTYELLSYINKTEIICSAAGMVEKKR